MDPVVNGVNVGIMMSLNFSGLLLLRYLRPHESDSYFLNPFLVD